MQRICVTLLSSKLPSGIIAADLYYKVGSFFEDMGKYDGAMVSSLPWLIHVQHRVYSLCNIVKDVYMESRFLYDKASQPINVARAECAVAHIYHLKGAYKQAQQLFKDALERFKKEKGMHVIMIDLETNCDAKRERR